MPKNLIIQDLKNLYWFGIYFPLNVSGLFLDFTANPYPTVIRFPGVKVAFYR